MKCELCKSYLVPDKDGYHYCKMCHLKDERDLKLILKALRIIQKDATSKM